MAETKMTTTELTEKLHSYYQSKNGAWAFITQLRNGTGHGAGVTRTADAMAMGLWPSTGLELIGFELKVSRSDWLHELKDPTKAEEIKQFCDRWYLVIPDESIIKPGELPAGWGLMVASGRGRTMKVKTDAPLLSPVDIDRLLLASIFRNITEKNIPFDMHRDIVKRAEEWAIERTEAKTKQRLETAEETAHKIEEFESATGIKFTTWGRDHLALAKVVKAALEGRYDLADQKVNELAERAERIAAYIKGEEVAEYRL